MRLPWRFQLPLDLKPRHPRGGAYLGHAVAGNESPRLREPLGV
jgi:hypothetical protein